jgi:hypothetical protein
MSSKPTHGFRSTVDIAEMSTKSILERSTRRTVTTLSMMPVGSVARLGSHPRKHKESSHYTKSTLCEIYQAKGYRSACGRVLMNERVEEEQRERKIPRLRVRHLSGLAVGRGPRATSAGVRVLRRLPCCNSDVPSLFCDLHSFKVLCISSRTRGSAWRSCKRYIVELEQVEGGPRPIAGR